MKNWERVKLGSLLIESKISSDNPDSDKRIRVRLNTLGIEKRPNTNDKEGATKYYIRKAGQFVYGKQNLHKGAFGIIPVELDGYESSSDIPSFDVHASCYPEWIYYFFKNNDFYTRLEGLAKGVGSKRIQPFQLFDLDIYLPNKNEQSEILDKVRDVEIKSKEIISEIEKQEQLLTLLRQSILHYAADGSLTRHWRAKIKQSNSIQTIIEQAEKTKKLLIQKGKGKKEKILRPISENEIPFAIPDNWRWVRLQSLIEDLRYGTSKKCDYGLGKTMVLRIPNIINGKVDFKDLKSTDLSQNEIDSLNLSKGDILIIRSNGSETIVGKTAVVDEIKSNFSFAGYLLRARPLKEFVSSDYIQIILESRYIRDKIELPIKDISGVKNINSEKINNLAIPFTEYSEQIKIIEEVKRLNLILDHMQEETEENREHIENIKRSILQQLLGDEPTITLIQKVEEEESYSSSRKIKFDPNTILMEILELLQKHGRLHAEDLWKMSKHYDDKNIGESIDRFYSDLKEKIEINKTVKEVDNEKGYLELA